MKFVLPYQRLGGEAPQTPSLLPQHTPCVLCTSVKVNWKTLASIALSSQIDVSKRVNREINLLSVHKLVDKSAFRKGALCHASLAPPTFDSAF